ncbi:MAG: Fe-S cluster assembly protein SufD [Candidatus Omnitrophica bacterium CG11_big_fil_rev_8_21_14_0_20_63_9]|nr:MAG: Fe-S cluster assembly protein SufD [Candidatus Omnitrophica bacterium CG11_big_fil_rev_8_21_14_0_20_63_9]
MGFDQAALDQLSKELREPQWLTALRRTAWARHAKLPWPHPSDDIWRRTDVTLLDPSKGFAPTQPSLLQSVKVSDAQLTQYMQPLGDERLIVRANGAWLTQDRPRDLAVEDLARASTGDGRLLRQAIEADGLSDAEQKLTTLNTAFHHDDVAVQVPAGYTGAQTVRMVRLFSIAGQQAIFPLTIITVGAGSRLTLIDEYVSLPADGGAQPHLINARIELVLEPGAQLHYVRLQRWGSHAREFLLQRATLAEGSTLTMANINLGAALSKAHIVTKLTGPNASTKLSGFVFGHHAQHIDQHTLQDHQAPNTTSDLAFRAALQDQSRMIYTGLIRIAKSAKQTNAYQANHNLLLSEGARAETIPMLEILADDVQCKHGASIGPIDEEQTFYLMSRGMPRAAAQRLIVMGFIEPVMQQIPFAPLQEQLRLEIEGELHA